MADRPDERRIAAEEIGRKAIAGADPTRLAGWAAETVARHLDAEHAAVFDLTSRDGLSLRAGVGWNSEVSGTAPISTGEPLLLEALRDEGPVIRSRPDRSGRSERRIHEPRHDEAPGAGFRRPPPGGARVSGIAVAIRAHERPTGVLTAYRRGDRPFAAADGAVLRSVAEVLAEAERTHEGQQLTRREALLAQALREAPGRGELSIAVQPIYFLAGRVVHSTEVLVRWTHPDLGSVPPSEFIPIAEESGAIDEIGGWVLNEACALAARWRADDTARRLLPLSVNISAKQLLRPDFAARVAETLARFGASPRDLGLEITERAVLGDHEVSAARLAELRAMGISILLDDFGTGFSSLTHLKQLPLDVVKIDRSFIAGATTTERRDSAIVNAVTSIAGAFVIQVVAEGVESADQIETLRCLGCLLGQGYHLCPPTDPDLLPAAVEDRSAIHAGAGRGEPTP